MSSVLLRCRGVVLRDRRPDDLPHYIRWMSTPMDWQLWDAPWEHEGDLPSPDQVREKFQRQLAEPVTRLRTRFEVEAPNGHHVGWTNSYHPRDDPEIVALGINLPDVERGGRGAGTIAFALHAAYRFRREGCPLLFAETWSGNLRMIGLVRRLGFDECRRLSRVRQVRGQEHDAVRFLLRPEVLWLRCPWLKEATFLEEPPA